MKYMGSKARLAKYILPIILKDRKEGQWYIEPFVGGANLISKVKGNRIGADINKYLIALLKEIKNGYKFKFITKEEYTDIKNNKDKYPLHIVGYAGIVCSYSGKWFGGYAGITQTKQGTRNYIEEGLKNISKQDLTGIKFYHCSYKDLTYPPKSIIYCDIPYKDTTAYNNNFDYKDFYKWIKEMSNNGYKVFISEYSMPKEFECIWEQSFKSSLSANGKYGGNKNSIEKLFTLR